MKKRVPLKKKYANGTQGVSVNNYMQSPSDALVQNDLMRAKATAESELNPWAIGVEMGSAFLAQAAGSGKLGELVGKKPEMDFADGSSGVPNPGAVEVEGEEAFETPSGQTGTFDGPSHEEGGMLMDVTPQDGVATEDEIPEGTKVYSDRILFDGKTMAERKEAREKSFAKIEKLLAADKTDMALKNSHSRRAKAIEMEDAQDLQFQELAGAFKQAREMAYGTGEEGIEYAGGTPGVMGPEEYQPAPNFTNNFGDTIPSQMGPEVEPASAIGFDSLINSFGDASAQENLKGYESTVNQELITSENDSMYMPTAGDALGMIGNLQSTFSPLQDALNSRVGDLPNTNQFKDYGKEALATNGRAEQFAATQRAVNERNLASESRSAKISGRNGARGINQKRAMDLAVSAQTSQAQGSAEAQYANQMMQLMGERAGLQNDADLKRMTGAQAKELADIQDRDRGNSAISKARASKGEGFQRMGKDLNEIAMNPKMIQLLKDFGKYVQYNADGTMSNKPKAK